MPISLHIEAANVDELMNIFGSLSGAAAAPATAGGARRGRPPGKTSEPAAEITAKPNGELPAGMEMPQTTANDDMFGDGQPVAQAMKPTAATPQPMTQEQFLAAMRGLLGKGKDDAVRAKVAAMGYAKVRDVPTEKMAEVYAAAQQV